MAYVSSPRRRHQCSLDIEWKYIEKGGNKLDLANKIA